MNRHFKMIKFLLNETNFNKINHEDGLGETALNTALFNRNLHIFKFLYSKGADPYIKDVKGKICFIPYIKDVKRNFGHTPNFHENFKEEVINIMASVRCNKFKEELIAVVNHPNSFYFAYEQMEDGEADDICFWNDNIKTLNHILKEVKETFNKNWNKKRKRE